MDTVRKWEMEIANHLETKRQLHEALDVIRELRARCANCPLLKRSTESETTSH